MNETQAPAANGAKQIGILTYVFKYGLLGWGLGAGAAYVAIEWHRHPEGWAALLLWAVWFFPLMGMGAGLIMWVLGRVFGKQLMSRKPGGANRR